MRISDWSQTCALPIYHRRADATRVRAEQGEEAVDAQPRRPWVGDPHRAEPRLRARQRDAPAALGEHVEQFGAQAVGRDAGYAGVGETCGQQDRKSVGAGKSVSVRVDLGGRRVLKKKKKTKK